MPKTINDLMQTVKTSCENDTIMYCFKNDVVAEAYDRTTLLKKWASTDADTGDTYYEEMDSYYYRKVMPRLVNELVVNVFYKNTNGVWVDYNKCIRSYPTLAIAVSAVRYQDVVKIDTDRLPRCTYMDSEYYMHNIDEHDGTDNDDHVGSIEIDTNDRSIVQIESFSIDEPLLPFTARHIMPDLKLTLPTDYARKQFLVWLNGSFVPTTKDSTYANVFYLKEAMTMIGSRCLNQASGSTVTKTDNATVTLDDDNNVYRLDADLRIFAWSNVTLSDWLKPIITTKIPITYNYSSIYVVETITFSESINANAHMIMENGVVLDPTEYTIDADDPRKITLKNVSRNAYALLNEVVSDITENKEYYTNVNPLSIVKVALTDRAYSLINFSTSEEGKTLYLKRSYACATNFPYKGEITFPNIEIGDLILVNGTFNKYEWIHKYSVFFPLFRFSFNGGDEGKIEENQVQRLYFVAK